MIPVAILIAPADQQRLPPTPTGHIMAHYRKKSATKTLRQAFKITTLTKISPAAKEAIRQTQTTVPMAVEMVRVDKVLW
jgi:hypothetical protein